jgi:hypothetical protein
MEEQTERRTGLSPEIAFVGDFPQFLTLREILGQAGLTATNDGPLWGRPALYISDTAHAAALLTEGGAPCIVVTEEPSADSIQRWLDAGAAACLVTPIVAPALLSGLRNHLRSRSPASSSSPKRNTGFSRTAFFK